MRSKMVFLMLIGIVATSYAREPKPYQTGVLLRMDAVHCGVAEKDAKSFAGQLLGTDSGSKKSQDVLCQEYVLQADTLIYHLRPKEEKHPMLLPVGGRAQFRLEKGKMLLRVEDLDNKDHDYIVVSMVPRTDSVESEVTDHSGRRLSADSQK